VNWTLLQVSVAVLLDNFVSETERGKEREQAIIREIKMVQDSIGNVLDRMLFLLAREFFPAISRNSVSRLMNQAEFVQVMRKQVTYFIKRRLHRVYRDSNTSRLCFFGHQPAARGEVFC
jgi:hypothetical protein